MTTRVKKTDKFEVSTDAQNPNNTVFIRSDDTVDEFTKTTTAQIQRIVTQDTGANPKALRVATFVNADITSTEWAISAEMDCDSNTSSTGFTAMSAVTLKNGTGACFGEHVQVKDRTLAPNSSTGGTIVGCELNIQANGPDDNTSRYGYDIIARTYEPGFATAGAGEFTAGVRIRNSSSDISGGKWNNAIIVEDGVQAIPNGITLQNSPSTVVGYGLRDEGAKARGIDLRGEYGTTAIDCKLADLTTSDVLIRLKDRGKVEFDTDVFMKWDSTNDTGNGSLSLGGQNTKPTGATAGAAAALPSNPVGYLAISINGFDRLIPYYGG